LRSVCAPFAQNASCATFLKGATLLNRLKVFCEGPTDIPIFEELVGQVGEAPKIVFADIAGWPVLRNKDPDFLLLGSSAAIVIMDGDQGRELHKHDQPLTDLAEKQKNRLVRHGIDLHVLRRYGIENYIPQYAVERVLGLDLSDYFPVPEHVPFTEHLSEDNTGFRYRFRRWVASKLDLKMPRPRRPLYSKRQNSEVAKFINLQAHLAGTDLFRIIEAIVQRARELQED